MAETYVVCVWHVGKRWRRLCWREEWESFRLIVGAECESSNYEKEVRDKYVFILVLAEAFKGY